MVPHLRISSIVIVIMTIFVISGLAQSQSNDDRWMYVTSSSSGTKVYQENSGKMLKNGNIVRWTKYVKADGTSSLELMEYDCKQRKTRSLEYIGYDISGRVTDSDSSLSASWKAIIPDSIGEALFENECDLEDLPLIGQKTNSRSDTGDSQKTKIYTSGKDDLGVDYAIVITTQANLREDTDANSPVILQIPKGDLVVLLSPNPIGGWYNVIHIKSNQEGWIHTSTILTYYTKNRKPNMTIPSRATGSYEKPSLEVKNDTGKTMSLNLGDKRYVFMPQESKTMTFIPGMYKFHASAPNTIPDFGEQNFQAGHIYTWKFYIIKVQK